MASPPEVRSEEKDSYDCDDDLDLTKSETNSRKGEKINKKIQKIKRNLSVKEGVQFCDCPSKILCIQNGGLGNGVSQEDLFSLLSPFGEIVDIIMLPRKQFSFVCFASEGSSQQAVGNLNGHLLRKGKDPSQDVILYLIYVRKAPPNIVPLDEKPPGLHVIEEFIDEDKENELLCFVESEMKAGIGNVQGHMKHRQVLHYGFEFKYDVNDVDVNEPLPSSIPEVCEPFLKKACDCGLVSHLPDQLTINQYKPGQGIPPHVDTPAAFEDGILSLSIGSQTVMDFRNMDGKHLAVFLPRRSLLVMTGESRYSWSHGITPRKSDIINASNGKSLTLLHRQTRTSFTFRKVVKDRGESTEKGNLNSQMVPQTEMEAIALEKAHVHEVYNDIADHFSGTRYKPWPRVVEFVLEQSPHSFLADVGCGNGKCLGVNKNLFEIGCDYSSNLASICGSRGFQTCVADVTCLPLRSDMFDVVLCIAVIHHMATRDRRIRAVSEVVRILKEGGKALIYVWAMEQNLDKQQSKYIKANRQRQIDAEKVRSQAGTTMLNESSEHSTSIPMNQTVEHISIRRKPNLPAAASDTDIKSSTETNTKQCINSASEEALVVQTKKQLPVHVNRTQFQDQDMLVPWKLKGKQNPDRENPQGENPQTENSQTDPPSKELQLYHRYYHVFRQGELEATCKRIPNCVVSKSYYDQGNWCTVIQKVS